MTNADQGDHFTNDRVHDHKGYLVKASDPYGLWHIEAKQGSLPEVLKGSFTGRVEAFRKIDWYLNMKEEKENKPPQDKNTRKVQEILQARNTGE